MLGNFAHHPPPSQGRRMKSSIQKSEHVLVIPGGLLATRSHADSGCSAPAHEVDGDLAQDSQVAGRRPIPNAAVILAEGDIQHPMEPIFDTPYKAPLIIWQNSQNRRESDSKHCA